VTKTIRIILGVSLGLLALIVVPGAVVAGLIYFAFPETKDQEHLPDEVLIQNFHDHRTAFEQLRIMLERDDDIFRIDEDWTDPPEISQEKVGEYRRLFDVVGTRRGFYNRRNPLRIELIASARGWVTSGSTKGYVFLEEPPETLDPSLDRFHTGNGANDRAAYRHIEGNWYLFFER